MNDYIIPGAHGPLMIPTKLVLMASYFIYFHSQKNKNPLFLFVIICPCDFKLGHSAKQLNAQKYLEGKKFSKNLRKDLFSK